MKDVSIPHPSFPSIEHIYRSRRGGNDIRNTERATVLVRREKLPHQGKRVIGQCAMSGFALQGQKHLERANDSAKIRVFHGVHAVLAKWGSRGVAFSGLAGGRGDGVGARVVTSAVLWCEV